MNSSKKFIKYRYTQNVYLINIAPFPCTYLKAKGNKIVYSGKKKMFFFNMK